MRAIMVVGLGRIVMEMSNDCGLLASEELELCHIRRAAFYNFLTTRAPIVDIFGRTLCRIGGLLPPASEPHESARVSTVQGVHGFYR